MNSLNWVKYYFCKYCSHNCSGQGICLKAAGKNQAKFQCNCNAGFFGRRCELYLGGCNMDGKPSPLCQSDGICMDTHVPFGYKCDCPRGLVGVHCEKTVQSLIDALVRAVHKWLAIFIYFFFLQDSSTASAATSIANMEIIGISMCIIQVVGASIVVAAYVCVSRRTRLVKWRSVYNFNVNTV